MDRQPRAAAQDRRLEQQADELGQPHDDAGAVAGDRLEPQDLLASARPAVAEIAEHAHGFEHFGIAHAAVDGAGRYHGVLVGGLQRLLGHRLVDEGESEQRDAAAQGDQAQHRVEHEHERQDQRRPGSVEEGENAGARQELAHRVEVAARLSGIGSDPVETGLELGGQYPLAQELVHPAADPHQDPGADHFQQGHHAQQSYRDQGQHQQGRFAPAVQHAVVDLHHVQRRYEHQQVDERTERRGHEEGAAAGGQGRLHFRFLFSHPVMLH